MRAAYASGRTHGSVPLVDALVGFSGYETAGFATIINPDWRAKQRVLCGGARYS
jgi:hypothetical protein